MDRDSRSRSMTHAHKACIMSLNLFKHVKLCFVIELHI